MRDVERTRRCKDCGGMPPVEESARWSFIEWTFFTELVLPRSTYPPVSLDNKYSHTQNSSFEHALFENQLHGRGPLLTLYEVRCQLCGVRLRCVPGE